MSPELRNLIVRLLNEHRIMTLATNRSDGWPQATVVGYANDGLVLYCFVARTSQKYANWVAHNTDTAAGKNIQGTPTVLVNGKQIQNTVNALQQAVG